MARQQYLFSDPGRWIGASGNAALVIFNRSGSGKKVKISSLGVRNLAGLSTAPGSAPPNLFALARATGFAGGKAIPTVQMDTAGSLPVGVRLSFGGSATQGGVLRRVAMHRAMSAAGSTDVVRHRSSGRTAGIGLMRRKDQSIENATIRTGEAIALFPASFQAGHLVRVTGDIVVKSTPNRTYAFATTVPVEGAGNVVLALENSGTEPVALRELTIEEVGTFDTPYFQLVPVGGLDAGVLDDVQARFLTTPMDTAYGALDPTKIAVMTDVPILPLGVPSAYFAEGAAGSPKGMSYLQTKDFLGPVLRVLFPEGIAVRTNAVAPDDIGVTFSEQGADLGVMRSGITIREGEGLALISSAETALNVNNVGVSGWGLFEFSGRITVDPSFVPDVTVTGVVPGSDVVILEAGTTNVLATGNAILGTTYNYPSDEPDVIDIGILQNGYVPLYVRNFNLNQAGATLPVAQVADRNFV